MLNNAIDHSSGQTACVLARQDTNEFSLFISDDGLGVFEKISKALKLTDKRQALFELSKGKFTTDPKKHSGEGIFFTSQMFDAFSIVANELRFFHMDFRGNDTLLEFESERKGTGVFMIISLGSTRTTKEIFNSYTEAPEDYDFSRTVVRMKLAAYGGDLLISRSQAKRLVARFD